jgi:cysteinyl-tRNA synthetase
MTLKLHNTLTRTTENFTPRNDNTVTLYTCGPTVYDYPTVGNWAGYIYWDILVRILIANGYTVNRVMNITDVGHLVSDADEGQDKLEKGAKREGKTAWEVAEFYAEDFLVGIEKLGLIMPEHVVRATDYIPQQLDLVHVLKEKGVTYQIDDGIYFDTSKFSTYADFAGLDLEAQKAGARVAYNTEKHNPSDFALWKFTPSGEKRDMEWETPGELLDAPADAPKMGFPGWHLECSTMAMSILGSTIDIHTGGIDHIPVHHTNEIAQSETASGQLFSRFWLHNNHLKVNGTKISKSLGNGYTLQNLATRGFSPFDYRMFILQGQYSNEGNFTFENLAAAQSRLRHWRNVAALRHQAHSTIAQNRKIEDDPSFAVVGLITEALNDNLNTPEALRIIDEVFSHLEAHSLDHINHDSLQHLLETIDELLGLQLINSTPDISDDIKKLIIERERARDDKDWRASDDLRDKINEQGIAMRDTSSGTVWEYAETVA